jgi:hypothetical protein
MIIYNDQFSIFPACRQAGINFNEAIFNFKTLVCLEIEN